MSRRGKHRGDPADNSGPPPARYGEQPADAPEEPPEPRLTAVLDMMVTLTLLVLAYLLRKDGWSVSDLMLLVYLPAALTVGMIGWGTWARSYGRRPVSLRLAEAALLCILVAQVATRVAG